MLQCSKILIYEGLYYYQKLKNYWRRQKLLKKFPPNYLRIRSKVSCLKVSWIGSSCNTYKSSDKERRCSQWAKFPHTYMCNTIPTYTSVGKDIIPHAYNCGKRNPCRGSNCGEYFPTLSIGTLSLSAAKNTCCTYIRGQIQF